MSTYTRRSEYNMYILTLFIFCLYNLISETTIKVSCRWLYLLLILTVLIFLFVQTVYCRHTEWIRLSDTGPQCLLHQGGTLSIRDRPCKLNYSGPGHVCYYLWTLIKMCYFCVTDKNMLSCTLWSRCNIFVWRLNVCWFCYYWSYIPTIL